MKGKKKWCEEEYLNEKGNKKGRIWKTRMRAGAVPLKAELFREHRSKSNMCTVCGIRAVENQTHMIVDCSAYEIERNAKFKSLDDVLDSEDSRSGIVKRN